MMKADAVSRVLLSVIALLAALAVAGCGPRGGLSDRYVAERLAWQAQKLRRAMLDNPELAGADMEDRLAAKYTEIVRTFPPPEGDPAQMGDAVRDIAAITAQARLRLAALDASRGNLDEAIRLDASVRDSYAFDRGSAVQAAEALARSYEAADRWEDAVDTYERLSSDWPPAASEDGAPDLLVMRAPIRIASGYLERGDQSLADEWFRSARSRLLSSASEWRGTPTADVAVELVAETYEMQGRWSEAAETYKELDETGGASIDRPTLWLKLADLYDTRLREPAIAVQYYTRVEEAQPSEASGATAAIALARHDIDRGAYDEARRRLERVAAAFKDDQTIAATATYYVAVSYEREGRWDSAVAQYGALAAQYPTTVYGLTALLHVAERYRSMGEAEAAATAFERAAQHYERVVRDYGGTPAELAARSYLIDVRVDQGKWPEAAESLVAAAERFPDSDASPGMLYQAGQIYETDLGDTAKARGVFERLVREFPDSPAAQEARKRLDALETPPAVDTRAAGP